MRVQFVVTIADEHGTQLEQVKVTEENVAASDIADILERNLECDGDGPDLSKATLFNTDRLGRYIPHHFAMSVDRSRVTGVSSEDYTVLEAGPDHEHYWDAWADVLDNAKITDPVQGECYLHHDGDLWVVPVEKEPVKTETGE